MQNSAPQASDGSPRRRLFVFTIGAIALPFVAVLLIKGMLRLAGVGATHRMPFQPVEDRAQALLARVENIHPESEEMLYNRARLLVLHGDTAGARTYFDRYRAAR